jgi:penicillin-binding protein 2
MFELIINPGVELRNSRLEIYHFRLRLAIASGLVLCTFFLLFARYFYLQVIQH